MTKRSTILLVCLFIISLLFLAWFGAVYIENMNTGDLAREMFEKCRNKNNFNECYQNSFESLTKSEKFSKVVTQLEKLKTYDTRINNCHLIAHVIARTELLKNPNDWANLLSTVPSADCGGGFVHGVLEEYISENSGMTISGGLIRKTCDKKINSILDYSNCVHALGHLVAIQTGYNLIEASSICLQIPPDLNQDTCLSGVFMEYTTRINGVDHGYEDSRRFQKKESVDEYKNICNSLLGKAAEACWVEYARVNLIYYKGDIEKTLLVCEGVSSREGSKGCSLFTISLSLDVSKTIDPKKIIGRCERFRKDLSIYNDCRLTVLSVMAFNSPNLLPGLITYCKSTDDSLKSACFKQLGSVMAFFANLNRDDLCIGVDKSHVVDCNFGSMQKI